MSSFKTGFYLVISFSSVKKMSLTHHFCHYFINDIFRQRNYRWCRCCPTIWTRAIVFGKRFSAQMHKEHVTDEVWSSAVIVQHCTVSHKDTCHNAALFIVWIPPLLVFISQTCHLWEWTWYGSIWKDPDKSRLNAWTPQTASGGGLRCIRHNFLSGIMSAYRSLRALQDTIDRETSKAKH